MSKTFSRRRFLRDSLVGVASLSAGQLAVPVFSAKAQSGGDFRMVVMIQLLGGLDPLLVLPYTGEFAALDALRGSYSRIDPGGSPVEVVAGKMAVHPQLAKLETYLNRTRITLHTGNAMHVGPVRSHDLAQLRMALGGTRSEYGRTGWTGRAYDRGIQLIGFGGTGGSFNCDTCSEVPIVCSKLEEFNVAASPFYTSQGGSKNSAHVDKVLRELNALSPSREISEAEAQYRKGQSSMFRAVDLSAETLQFQTNAYDQYLEVPEELKNASLYNNYQLGRNASVYSGFANKLRNIASLAYEAKSKQRTDPLITVAALGGFDLHKGWHDMGSLLITTLAHSLKIFLDDLTHHGLLDETVVMIVSEFGRTIAGNGSGTDHGVGYPSFVIGGNVRGGVYGDPLSVDDLARRADTEHGGDNAWPREVAQERLLIEILENHLRIDPKTIFTNGVFDRIPDPGDIRLFNS